jgi:hypothetical protein
MSKTSKGAIMLNPNITASIHNAGLVVLHIPTGRLFTSNLTGALVWQGLERKTSIDGIATEISQEFGVPEEAVREHTMQFVFELERNGLVVRGPEC